MDPLIVFSFDLTCIFYFLGEQNTMSFTTLCVQVVLEADISLGITTFTLSSSPCIAVMPHVHFYLLLWWASIQLIFTWLLTHET